MAKKSTGSKTGPSGSQLIRDQIAKGVTKPSEIIAAIQAENGIGVSNALIGSVKQAEKKKTGKIDKTPRGPKPSAKTAVAAGGFTVRKGIASKLTAIDVAIELVEAFGADKAREMIRVMGDTRGNG